MKASNFVQRSADKFSTGLCLDFACSTMASRVMAMEMQGFV